MNIRIFLLHSEQNSYAARLSPELKCVFGDYLASDDGVRSFPSVREASDQIRLAFGDSHALLFFVEPARYAESKKALAASIGLSLHCDRAMFEKSTESARSLANEESEFAETHAYLPEGGRPIVCGDWLYSGFSVTSGNQTVIMLPLMRGRTEVMLRTSVIPMLNGAYRIRLNMDALRAYHAERLSAVCQSNDIRIAVAGTNAADYCREYVSSAQALQDRIVFAEKAEKRGALAPADYVVNLSITAAEFFGTPYGVAISNAFYTGSDPSAEKVIYLAITNEHETALREVRSVPGEDIPTLLSRCCGDLCTFLSDIAGTDTKKRIAAEDNKKSLISQYRRVIAVVAVVIVALGLFCGVYFKMHGYTLKTWAANAWSVVFPGSKPIFEEETQPETTTEEPSMAQESTKRASADATTAAPSTTAPAVTTTAPATTAAPATRSSSSGSNSNSGGGSSSWTRAPSTQSAQTTEPASAAEPSSRQTTEAPSAVPTEPSGGNTETPSAPENDSEEWPVGG